MKTITIALLAALAAPAFAHDGDLTLGSLCAQADVPTQAEYDPRTHADNFCALATHEPGKAVAQLGKMIATTRARTNPNRHYFDPRTGSDDTYIQLLTDWMVEENDEGREWKVIRQSGAGIGPDEGLLWTQFVIIDELESHTRPRRCVTLRLHQLHSHSLGSEPQVRYRVRIFVSGGHERSAETVHHGFPEHIVAFYKQRMSERYPYADERCTRR